MPIRISVSKTDDIRLEISEPGELLLTELEQASERGVAVFGGAIVDEALERALTCLWRNEVGKDTVGKTTKDVRSRVLGERGRLNFGLKIQIAYLTGMIGPLVFADLERIRKVRNAFSHWVRIKDSKPVPTRVRFDEKDIKKHCNFETLKTVTATLNGAPLPTDTPKERFLAMTLVCFSAFELFRGNPRKEPKIVNQLLRL
jgi:hypothetical protein